MATDAPSQLQSGLGALVSGLGQGFSSQMQMQNQAALQNAYLQAMFGRQAAKDQTAQDIAAQNNATRLQQQQMKPAPGAIQKPLTLDLGTQRIINHAPNYQRVYNDYVDLYNQVNSTDDPNQKQMLAQQALAHGNWTAPINTWMSDSPDLTPGQRAAGQKIAQLTQQAQQAGAGEQLRLMHAMETLNQQTGSMRPASPEMVQHVYDTTPGLDAPKEQFAYMMGTQADSSVPWEGLAINAKLQGKDPTQIIQQGKQYKQQFHQVNSVPYDQDNRPQAPNFGYGQPARNGVPVGGAAEPVIPASPGAVPPPAQVGNAANKPSLDSIFPGQ